MTCNPHLGEGDRQKILVLQLFYIYISVKEIVHRYSIPDSELLGRGCRKVGVLVTLTEAFSSTFGESVAS